MIEYKNISIIDIINKLGEFLFIKILISLKLMKQIAFFGINLKI